MVDSMEKIVALCKSRGYVYPGSEIYGGLANTWDYGPLGNELKNNIKAAWRKKFIQEQPNIVGLDAAILMNPETWVASGHVGGFSDPLIDCKECKTRHRADKLIEEWAHEQGKDMIADGMTDEQLINFINENKIPCPNCGKTNFTDIRKFNLMFKTFQGVTEDKTAEIYLRPETAQGIFVDFKNVLRKCRIKSYKFHTLRHTFASNCIEVGMDVKSLSEMLGHSSVEITLNKYVHSNYKLQKKYLEKL